MSSHPADQPVKRRSKRNYINNHDLLIQLAISNEKGQMTDILVNMLTMLAARYGSKSCYASYPYLDDMKAYAMYMICRTWHRFDCTKSENPFAFFTQCIKRSFWQYLNKEKSHRDLRDELLIDAGLNPSTSFQVEYEQERWSDDQ